jgi:hypothetical protein
MKIIFFVLLELVLSRGAFVDGSNDEEFTDRDNEISADINDVMKVIGSVRSKKISEDGKMKTKSAQLIPNNVFFNYRGI